METKAKTKVKTKTKTEKIIFIVFSIIGIICLIASAVMMIRSAEMKKSYVKTDAVIIDFDSERDIDGETNKHAIIRYRADGIVYETTTNEYNSSWNLGDHIEIYYNPDSPEKFFTGFGSTFGVLMLGLFGIVFACVGLIPTLISAKKSSNNQRLMQSGTKLEAKVVGFDYNENFSVNGRHPYIIEVESLFETGERCRFLSGNVWEPLGEEILGRSADVYLEPGNPDKYFVDVDSIFTEH